MHGNTVFKVGRAVLAVLAMAMTLFAISVHYSQALLSVTSESFLLLLGPEKARVLNEALAVSLDFRTRRSEVKDVKYSKYRFGEENYIQKGNENTRTAEKQWRDVDALDVGGHEINEVSNQDVTNGYRTDQTLDDETARSMRDLEGTHNWEKAYYDSAEDAIDFANVDSDEYGNEILADFEEYDWLKKSAEDGKTARDEESSWEYDNSRWVADDDRWGDEPWDDGIAWDHSGALDEEEEVFRDDVMLSRGGDGAWSEFLHDDPNELEAAGSDDAARRPNYERVTFGDNDFESLLDAWNLANVKWRKKGPVIYGLQKYAVYHHSLSLADTQLHLGPRYFIAD